MHFKSDMSFNGFVLIFSYYLSFNRKKTQQKVND